MNISHETCALIAGASIADRTTPIDFTGGLLYHESTYLHVLSIPSTTSGDLPRQLVLASQGIMNPEAQYDTFDIIIIGAGPAGSLLAARLSSNISLRILVLEASQNRNEDADVRTPGLARNLLAHPDWQFQTSPEAGLNGRVIQPRGGSCGVVQARSIHMHSCIRRWATTMRGVAYPGVEMGMG